MSPYRPVDDWSYTEGRKVVDVTVGTTDDDDAYPSGWRYSLHYGTTDGKTILRYDNAHEETKGHEKHTGDTVEEIEFPGMVPLYERFLERVGSDLEGLSRRR
jgi:hypothetical protein